jgi:hypothetical protein
VEGSFVSAPSKGERLLLVLTPAIAMTAVAVGLRVGARSELRAALVYGTPAAAGAPSLAWQVVVFDEDQGAREPVAALPVSAAAHAGDAAAEWQGATNADGVAEMHLALPRADGVELEVRSGSRVLARGEARPPPPPVRGAPQSGWLRFARRDGAIALDVAALGQRVAPSYPAELWVRATDATTHAPLRDIAVALDSDTSLALAPGAAASGRTDSRGWTRVMATPVGLAVTVTLRAKSSDGRSGEWIGGLFMSPGAPRIDVAPRTAPGAPIALGMTMPVPRSTGYMEIDDASGRAWAATPALTPGPDGAPAARVQAPGLPPGLYWAVAATDPAGAATLGAGTLARPFFVASSDDAALALGTDTTACVPPRDPRETASAVSACLALSAIVPVRRYMALDGFAMQRALSHEARQRGLAVALGALAIAVVLEATLLLRAAAGSRTRTVAIAILVGLLGFALLAAFIVRV